MGKLGLIIFFDVAVANRLDRYEYAALENEPPHELARAEIVDVLSDDDFLTEVAVARIVKFAKAWRHSSSEAQIVSANRIAEMAYGCRLSANRKHLLLVHTVSDDFGAAAKRVCRLGDQQRGDDDGGCSQRFADPIIHVEYLAAERLADKRSLARIGSGCRDRPLCHSTQRVQGSSRVTLSLTIARSACAYGKTPAWGSRFEPGIR